IRFTDGGTQFGGRGEQRASFLFHDPQIIVDLQREIEAALRLDHFSRTDFTRRSRNRATDVCILKTCGEIQRVREEEITQQDAERIAPARVYGGPRPA